MKAIGVIPARWASSRFEGKVLADINGKPLIQHVWENAKKARLLDDLIIAADDQRVLEVAKGFGAKACFTSPKQPSGTDRISEVVNALDVEIVVNIQGDEPLIQGIMIDKLVNTLSDEKEAKMATLVKRITEARDILDPNVVKVVLDKKGYALYFSRSPIPYVRDDSRSVSFFDHRTWSTHSSDASDKLHLGFYKHIGLYAYTKEFLFTYTNLPFSKLEKAEKLEQLRALEHGFRIKTIETDIDTIGIDTPEDLERIRALLKPLM